MIIITRQQAYSAFEQACHLDAAGLLALHSFQNIIQFYMTLKANGFGGGSQTKLDGLDEAAFPLNASPALLSYYSGYAGHLNNAQALFDPDGEADNYVLPLAGGLIHQPPSRAQQVNMVGQVLDILRI